MIEDTAYQYAFAHCQYFLNSCFHHRQVAGSCKSHIQLVPRYVLRIVYTRLVLNKAITRQICPSR